MKEETNHLISRNKVCQTKAIEFFITNKKYKNNKKKKKFLDWENVPLNLVSSCCAKEKQNKKKIDTENGI